ncbi:hypothetical protein JTB14_001591 [Gonioctena quinquepunctata]|nr:hypothetical protein JTB14_001591 [Gonioctena quinquepunctata]
MDIRFTRGFPLAEALDIAYNEDIDVDIFIEPPEANVETDEDSADEDDGGLVDNLNSRQLRAAAEIRLPNNDRIGVEYTQNEISDAQDSEGLESTSASVLLDEKEKYWLKERRKQKPNFKPSWELNADYDIEQASIFPKANYSKYEEMSAVEIFEQFIDTEIIEYFVNESRRYALFLNRPDPKISGDEIRCFIAILIVSGYNNLPSKRDYWDSGDDMRNAAVFQAMRRNRFLDICRFIHCAGNTKIDQTDKAWKIRPFMEMLKERCIKNFIPEKNLSYDESMRKSPKANTEYDVLFGKAASPMLIMMDELPLEKQNLRYHFYMDNLFSNPALFSFLRFRGYSAIGTIRDNRIPTQCPLTNKTLFAKKVRGTSIEKTDGHLYIRWMDNAVVTMIPSSSGTQEVGQVKRYSQQQKRNIMIPRPFSIAKYNTYMGGTDQMDQNLACYRIGIRGKKWYWPSFTWLLDVAMQNSWLLYNKSRKQKLPQKDFRREVAKVYLKKYQVLPKGAGRWATSIGSPSTCRISNDIRFDRTDHFVKHTDGNKKKGCAATTCKSIIRTMCVKCDVALCVDCFIPFRSR